MVIMLVVLLVLSGVNLLTLAWFGFKIRGVVYTMHTRFGVLERTMDNLRHTLTVHVDMAGAGLQKALTTKTEVDVHREQEKAADMGIALAERMARLHPAGPRGEKMLTSFDKAKMAVDWAVEHCADLDVPIEPAEMRKLVEIRLEQAQPSKKKKV
jgi:hypothetical protein